MDVYRRLTFVLVLIMPLVDDQTRIANAGTIPLLEDKEPKFSIGSALRYLSKAVFSQLLLQGQDDDGTVEASLKSSHLEDSSDCVKRLLCELQAIKDRDLSWDEYVIKKSILPVLDYSSPTLQFNIAADVGRQEGIDQCSIVYNRCVFDSSDIMKLMRQRGTSLELPTNDNYECTVLFLWNKKRPSTNRPVEFPTSIADYGRSGF